MKRLSSLVMFVAIVTCASPVVARTLRVNCGNGSDINLFMLGRMPTITHALQVANPRDTILVEGTCNETVAITKDDITLDGQGITTVDGGGQTAITIDGARRVTIQGLTVQHGVRGLLVGEGAAVSLHDVTATDNTGDGISIQESATARLTDCTMQHNGQDGLNVLRSANVLLAGTIVSNDNARDGIHVSVHSVLGDGPTAAHITTNNNMGDGIIVTQHASFVIGVSGTMLTAQNNWRFGVRVAATSAFFLATGTTLTANVNGVTGQFGGGLYVQQNASFTMQAAGTGATLTVQDNRDRGVIVEDAGALFVGGGTVTIQRNAVGGLQAFRNAVVTLGGTSLAAQISQNTGNGVEVNGHASLRVSGGTTVSGNTARGIWWRNDAQGDLTNVTVQNNGAVGIEASDTSLQVRNSTIGGNTGGAVVLHFGTRATLSNNVIDALPITCDDTVLSQGTTLCL